jgi:hypothetical protein
LTRLRGSKCMKSRRNRSNRISWRGCTVGGSSGPSNATDKVACAGDLAEVIVLIVTYTRLEALEALADAGACTYAYPGR